MSINTKIYLNPHAHPKEVLEVIQKSLGTDFIQSGLRNDFDPQKPTSKENSWSLKLPKNCGNIELTDVDYFTLNIKDPLNQNYNTLFFFKGEDDPEVLNNEKLLSPKCSTIWLALGKKLVDFFGGKMLFSDSSSKENEKWYINKKGSFPQKMKGQSGDDRWYQYYNSLSKVKILTTQDLSEMEPFSCYDDDRVDSLRKYLTQYQLSLELAKKLKPKEQLKKKNKL